MSRGWADYRAVKAGVSMEMVLATYGIQLHRLDHGGGEFGSRFQDRPDTIVKRRQIEQPGQGVTNGQHGRNQVRKRDGKR